MRLKWVAGICVVAVSAVVAIWLWTRPQPPTPVSVIAGERILGIVHFPQLFVTDDRLILGPNTPATFEVRRASPPPGDDLLFGMRSSDGRVSANHYAVRTDRSFRVRPVRDEEWNLSTPVILRAHSLDSPQWKGRAFQPSGAQLHRAILSPDEKMIALLSQTETERPKGVGVMILPVRGTYRGTSYLDLFDTSSGERVGAVQAPYVGPGVRRHRRSQRDLDRRPILRCAAVPGRADQPARRSTSSIASQQETFASRAVAVLPCST